eukprot:9906653-Alexandrium_andersonii.AAC.1
MYARAAGPLAHAIQPLRTCAKHSLHIQSLAVPTTTTGTLAMTPAAVMAKPSLQEAFVQGSPWPSSGQRGSACAARASAWRTR